MKTLRRTFRPVTEQLESRLVLNGHHAAPPNLGLSAAMGDSYADEYQFYPPDQTHARGFVEILAFTGKASFGPLSRASQGEPRNAGFATNWARYGSTTTELVANQLPGLASQVASGKIGNVLIFSGGNDFLYYIQGVATSKPMTADVVLGKLAQVESKAQANIDTAVTTLLGANPRVHVVLGTLPNVGISPLAQAAVSLRPDGPALLAAVDKAILAYNAHLQNLGASNPRMAVADIAAAATQVAGAGAAVPFGGTTVTLKTLSDDYHSFFLADGLHVGTIGQGIIANAYIQAIDTKFGAHVSPLTPRQIVDLARLVQYRTRNVH